MKKKNRFLLFLDDLAVNREAQLLLLMLLGVVLLIMLEGPYLMSIPKAQAITASGSAQISDASISNPSSVPDWIHGSRYSCTITVDGQSFQGGCYESFVGTPDHEKYAGPADGTYDYTTYYGGDGYIYIVVNSSSAPGCPGTVQTGYPSQKAVARYRATGSIAIKKVSDDPSISGSSPCYSLGGAVYDVFSDQGLTTKVGSITTDADGTGSLHDLVLGKYYIKETTAPHGYALDESVHEVNVDSPDATATLDVSDAPQNDPARMTVAKLDKETGKASPLGAGTLEGAQFSVKYYDNLYSDISQLPSKPTRSWVFQTNKNGIALLIPRYIVSGDELYKAKGLTTLPLGTVTIQEIKAPNGYLLNDSTVYLRQVTPDGTTPSVNTFVAPEVSEQIIRGDFNFNKIKAVDNSRIAKCAFLVTSDTTGESHVIVTDTNGQFDSSADPHASLTNANDDLLSSDKTSITDSNALRDNAGVWFSGLSDTNSTPQPDNEKGSFPYDTYTITELRCEANKDLDLTSFKVTISRDKVNVDLGTVSDHKVTLGSAARDVADADRFIEATSDQSITDTVYYTGLLAGKQYCVHGTLIDKQTNKPLTDKEGKPLEASSTFTPSETNGQTDVAFNPLDASALDGHDIVVFETLTDENNTVIAKHEDINDAAQTISVRKHEVTLGSSAKDSSDSDKVIEAKTDASITDTVYYTGLHVPAPKTQSSTPVNDSSNQEASTTDQQSTNSDENKGSYSFTAQLIDKQTNKPITDKEGKPLEASSTFTPSNPDGQTDVIFDTVDASALDGHDIVVFETLTDENNTVIAKHEDINDAAQTIHASLTPIHLGSSAKDSADSDKTIEATSDQSITDTVEFENVQPDHTYKLTGTLMDKRSSKPIQDSDGKDISSSKTFKPSSGKGSTEVEFDNIDATNLAGQDIVVFEQLSDENDSLVATHENIDDDAQTIHVASPLLSALAQTGHNPWIFPIGIASLGCFGVAFRLHNHHIDMLIKRFRR